MTARQLRRRLHGGCGEPLISQVFEAVSKQWIDEAPSDECDEQTPVVQMPCKTDQEVHR